MIVAFMRNSVQFSFIVRLLPKHNCQVQVELDESLLVEVLTDGKACVVRRTDYGKCSNWLDVVHV